AWARRANSLGSEGVDVGRFDEQTVRLTVDLGWVDDDGRPQQQKGVFNRDEGPRRDTSEEGLAKLRPAFQAGGTITAGNSSQRSDGGAAVVVMERERAEQLGLKPLLRFVGFAVAGVGPEVLGIVPIIAIPKLI